MPPLLPYAHPRNHTHSTASPAKGLYFCSSLTLPGSGVDGMCGYFATPVLPSQPAYANYTDPAILCSLGYALQTKPPPRHLRKLRPCTRRIGS
jgi:hypothetical protein